MPCRVDLMRNDIYEGEIPDEAVEECLKVLRTVRVMALTPPHFLPATMVTMSQAHAAIFDLVLELKSQENRNADTSKRAGP